MSVSFNRLVPVNMNNVADRQAATNIWELGLSHSIVDDYILFSGAYPYWVGELGDLSSQAISIGQFE